MLMLRIRRYDHQLQSTFGIKTVRVKPSSFRTFSIDSNYRSWDIEYISINGNVPELDCETSDISTTSIILKSNCTVSRLVSSSDTPITGTFVISTSNGLSTDTLSLDASATEVEDALMDITETSLRVSKSFNEFDESAKEIQ